MLALCLLTIAPAIGDGSPITVVDSGNRTITIDGPAMKAIPIVAWSYEPLYILGASDRIAGVEKGSAGQYSYLPGISDKPIIGTYKEPDFEKIIQLKPDIVIVQPSYLKKVDEKLSPLGIKVVNLPFNSQSGFNRDLRTLAKLLGPGEERRAEEFISWKDGTLARLRNRTEGIGPNVRVYGEWSDTPWYTGSRASGMDDVISLAGGENIAGVLNPDGNLSKRYPTVDSEWVLKQNPQVVIIPAFDYYTGYMENSSENCTKLIEDAKSRSGINGTDAARNGRIYVIDAYLIEAVRGFIG